MIEHKIIIEIEPIYKIKSPHCVVLINDEEIINQDLQKIIKIEKKINNLKNNLLSIKIERSGRNNFVIKNDFFQSIKIKEISINDVAIIASIGNFKTIDNPYVKDDVIHTSDLNLNGVYEIKIPILTLKGERNEKVKSIKKFNKKKINADVVFFGASLTDWNFAKAKPCNAKKNNFADMFIKKYKDLKVYNFGFGGSTNQEILENVKHFLQNNHSKVIFIQLITCLGRQIKNSTTGEIYRWSLHQDNSKEDNFVDEFTGMTPKNILDFFVYLDVVPLLAMQIPELREIITEIENKNIKVFLILHHHDEFNVFRKVFASNVAPYFDIDHNSEYYKENNYHASPEEHEEFFKKLVNFYQNQVDKTKKL